MMKTITKEQYYQVLGLFITARQKQSEVDRLESEISNILKTEGSSHIGDAIYNYENSGTQEEFDKALSLTGFEKPNLIP